MRVGVWFLRFNHWKVNSGDKDHVRIEICCLRGNVPALWFVSSRIGNCQERGDKGKPTMEEKWAADDPAPPDRDRPIGPPSATPAGGPLWIERGGEPMEGPPGAESRSRNGMAPGEPRIGRDVITIRRGVGPGMGGSHDMFYFGGGSLEKVDPEMYKLIKADMDLEHQTRDLALQYRRASSDERAKLKEQIKDLVAKHFAVRQERRALQLKRIEADVQRLREATERRQKAREKLIEQRVSELLGRDEEPTF